MSRVLAISDLHCPFEREGYLDFCVDMWNKWDLDTSVFIGDIVDNHYVSYHETCADGLGGGDELDAAIECVAQWHDTFPDSCVTLGNHDRLPGRKANTAGIPTRWIRAYEDVLETPSWDFVLRTVIDGVQYIHGEGVTARTQALRDMQSTVQGHRHTECYVEWKVGAEKRVFGMQLGVGLDKDKYNMAYSKHHPRPPISCGIIIDGEFAANEMMPL